MQFHRALQGRITTDSWLTIGSFDGVHLGHQAIIRDMAEGAHAAGLPAVVLTFEPHPLRVLRPDFKLPLLTGIEERAALFAALGVDHVVSHPFNHQIAALSAAEFISSLKAKVGFSKLLVGYDFAMGRNREGNTARLRELGPELGFELHVFEPVSSEGLVFSSSKIRQCVAEGDVRGAAKMLGRPYSVAGKVIGGAQRGRLIGIPTANVAVPRGRAVPMQGVYACRVTIGEQIYGAATNIGVRPTFESDVTDETIEAHILDFNRDIYNEVIQVEFVERLRGEQKFSGIDALITQIKADIVRAREVLDETIS